MAITFTNMADKVLLWIHGRRLGIVGDALNGTSTALVLDGIPIGSSRGAMLISAAAALNSTGSIALTGSGAAAAVGDAVVMVYDVVAHTDITSDFETTISVAGHIQETVASGGTDAILVYIQPQS